MTIETVIERAMRNAEERLGRATVPARAYAVAIFSHDPEELAAANIVVGLERDREVALQSAEHTEALWRIWSPHLYGASAADEPQLVLTDPEFVEAQEAAIEELDAQGIWRPQQHVLNRVAQRLGSGTLPFAVTGDFVVYAWDQDDQVCEENIRFSAGPEALAELERKALI